MSQIYFKNVIEEYKNLPDISSIQSNITNLDSTLNAYHNNVNDTTKQAVEQAFVPLATYYAKLHQINQNLRKYLDEASIDIVNSQTTLVNEERYNDRVHPEETTVSREIMYGIFPGFRPTSLPYILTAGVFMSLLSIFIIFQTIGITGELHLPVSITQQFSTPAGVIAVPFYKNPMFLGGLITVLVSALVAFIVLYFKAKNTNSP